jgi:hypothetical protein
MFDEMRHVSNDRVRQVYPEFVPPLRLKQYGRHQRTGWRIICATSMNFLLGRLKSLIFSAMAAHEPPTRGCARLPARSLAALQEVKKAAAAVLSHENTRHPIAVILPVFQRMSELPEVSSDGVTDAVALKVLP